MWLQSLVELLGVVILSAGPLEGHGGKDSCHGMVGMAGETAIHPEGQYHMWTVVPEAPHKNPRDGIEIGPVQLAILVVKHLAMSNTEHFAGGGELSTAQTG